MTAPPGDHLRRSDEVELGEDSDDDEAVSE
jgi:hypothetical protein